MVSRKNVCYRQDLQPCDEDATEAERKITGGPLYPPELVRTLAAKGENHILLWTDDCDYDVTVKLGWGLDDVAALLVEAVTDGRFKGSEWCTQRPYGPTAACDAYVLCTRQWNEHAKRELPCEYYVKFAVSKLGTHILVVSCHV